MGTKYINLPQELLKGFGRFRQGSYIKHYDAYQSLADGQEPHTLVIACSDSRVDPGAIFDAGPGELFIVRNVANLVPPSEKDGMFHGTSAAVQYAVENLKVKNIVVMGHGDCGGVKAHLKKAAGQQLGDFIEPWLTLLDDVLEDLRQFDSETDLSHLAGLMEHKSVQASLHNLRTFDFVKKAENNGNLSLCGAWFSVMTGKLMVLDERTGQFDVIE